MAAAELTPGKPHQPLAFKYPKRSFGQKAPVSRCFQPAWYKKWPFLHYDESQDTVLCFTCLKAFEQKKLRSSNLDSAFVTRGFYNWKDATASFKKHQLTACHRQAVEVMITLPSTTRNVGEQLCLQHAINKESNREALYKIFLVIKFLCRQGLALRGDGCESDGNFKALLSMVAEFDENLDKWLKRKENVYTSPDIQNEIVKVMGIKLLRDLASKLKSSPFLTIMVDETTDVSNSEQATIVIRCVENFQVHEEFLGLYSLTSIESNVIVSVIKDVLIRMNLSINKLRGQCYDGASTMKGHKSGVSTQIRMIEPRAVYTHFYGHSLNLAASDALKGSKLMKDALETVHEITKLIKYSPRRESIFKGLKEDCPSNPGIRVLCPTRWTVRAESITSVIKNFDVLQATWDEASSIVKDLETKSRIRGVSAIMDSFDFIFGAMLGEMILGHADNLSSTLQHQAMSAAAGQELAHMTVQTLKTIRSTENFDLFWAKVNQYSRSHGVNEARLPRQRKTPRRLDEGTSTGYFHETPKQYYKQLYFEAVDLIINCIQDRFDQPGYETYSTLESLLIKACNREDYENELKKVCEFYKDDFDESLLRTQLQTLSTHFPQITKESGTLSFFDLKNYFDTLSSSQAALLGEVTKVMQLILVMPATNASSERSFSALRRVKSYLRSTMLQERLNYLMLLHVHKDRTDALCLKTAINDFIHDSEHRSNIFSKCSFSH